MSPLKLEVCCDRKKMSTTRIEGKKCRGLKQNFLFVQLKYKYLPLCLQLFNDMIFVFLSVCRFDCVISCKGKEKLSEAKQMWRRPFDML